MDQEPARPAEAAATGRKRSFVPMLLLPLIAFVAGIAAMGWLLAHWSGGATWLGVAPVPPPVAAEPPRALTVEPEPQPQAGQTASAQEPERLVIDPEISRRVALLEQRLGTLDLQSRTAVGNADRAEGLLVAFAARRALDRGVPLGYLEGLLNQRFGERHRAAVATIITVSRDNPIVTLEQLQDGLQQVAPQLRGGAANQNWWTALRAELGGLVTIRKAGTVSPLPEERLRRATRALDSGQPEVALVEVSRLQARDKAQDWIAKAQRYVSARNALNEIETAALLEPHTSPTAVASPPPVRTARPAQPPQARPKGR
jgi:hypothetical protein